MRQNNRIIYSCTAVHFSAFTYISARALILPSAEWAWHSCMYVFAHKGTAYLPILHGRTDFSKVIELSATISRNANHLLDGLPEAAHDRIFPYLETVTLPLGKVLYEPDDKLRYVYFPIDAIVSLLYVMESGASAEISVVGNEGVVGIALFMGGQSTPSRAVVQSAGTAWRLAAQQLMEEFNRHGELMLLLLSYTQALITQMSQTAVCNRHHHIDQQLCRWLLLSLDRLPNNQLSMTQELIANMLGVRREGVTAAAGKLQALGLIEYHRGKITVLDRKKLEQLSCECYAVVKKETDRLLDYKPSLPTSI